MSRRKSDGSKIRDGFGLGRGKYYEPFIRIHEFGNKGRSHRILGWKTGRVHHLLSDVELYFFLIKQWDENCFDIREQYPLLPIEDTISIAKDFGIKHPALKNKEGDEVVMTTDFVLTVQNGNLVEDIIRTIKPNTDLSDRTIDKFRIEKEFFNSKGYDWGVVTMDKINIVKARNIYYIYNSYFWDERYDLTDYQLSKYIYEFSNMLLKNNYEVLYTIEEFTKFKKWIEGEGLVFFKYLLAHKIIETNLDKPLTFHNMDVWLKEENKKC